MPPSLAIAAAKQLSPPHVTLFDAGSYPQKLQTQLAELRDLVEAHQTSSANHQILHFKRHTKHSRFQPDNTVGQSNPTGGKFSLRWEGERKIVTQKGPVTYEISNGKKNKVVHVN